MTLEELAGDFYFTSGAKVTEFYFPFIYASVGQRIWVSGLPKDSRIICPLSWNIFSTYFSPFICIDAGSTAGRMSKEMDWNFRACRSVFPRCPLGLLIFPAVPDSFHFLGRFLEQGEIRRDVRRRICRYSSAVKEEEIRTSLEATPLLRKLPELVAVAARL